MEYVQKVSTNDYDDWMTNDWHKWQMTEILQEDKTWQSTKWGSQKRNGNSHTYYWYNWGKTVEMVCAYASNYKRQMAFKDITMNTWTEKTTCWEMK